MSAHRLLLGAFATLALQGCALLQPYEVGTDAKIYKPACATSPPAASCNALSVATERAAELQAKYLEAAGQDELARKIAGSGVTLAAAYAMVLGVSDGIGPVNASDHIISLGAGSAAALGITSIFTNPQRQKVFIAGAGAVTCARLAATPFQLNASDLTKLNDTLDGATEVEGKDANGTTPGTASKAAVTPFAKTITDVESYVDRMAAATSSTLSPDYIAGIRKEIDAARAALRRGYAVRQEATQIAPSRLLNQLGKIDIGVATQLQATTPDINTILQIRSNLQASAANIAPEFGTVKKTPTENVAQTLTKNGLEAAEAEAYNKALSEMRSATNFLNHLADDMERRVTAIGTTFESCNFEPVSLAIRLHKDSIDVKANTAASYTFLVSEGQAPFVAEVVSATDKITVDFSPAFGNRGVVNVEDGLKAGTYEIVVYDRTLSPATLTLNVKAVEPPPNSDQSAGGGSGNGETGNLQ